jgi:hypothetical protein
LDRQTGYIEDLSERSESRGLPGIPRNLAILIFALLAISGILIGAFLPGLIEGSEQTETQDPTSDIINTLISSYIDSIEIAGTSYRNIPVPTAFQVLFLEGDPSTDYAIMDSPINEMIEYLIEDGHGFELTVSAGAGMDQGISDYILKEGSMNGESGGSAAREVPVGLEEDEGTVVFELRIWEGVSE